MTITDAEDPKIRIHIALAREIRADGTVKITQCDIARCARVRLPFIAGHLRELEREGAIARLTHVRANPAVWKLLRTPAGVTAPPARQTAPTP